jgi:squalene-hopene/tetraprenyl-beta-curcumene cyclase
LRIPNQQTVTGSHLKLATAQPSRNGSACLVDAQRLLSAYEVARRDLLDEGAPSGYWTGELADSALSTATAVSALALVKRNGVTHAGGCFSDEDRQQQLATLIVRGLRWLAVSQNADGGWGDTDKSVSNIATTMLVQAAFHLTGVPADHADLLVRAQAYVDRQGGVAGVRKRYGKDKTFAVPILTNCALAGLVPWSEVAALPFELACLPHSTLKFLRLPVVSYALPALVGVGQAKYYFHKPLNPLVRLVRGTAIDKSLRVLEEMQPSSGGFLEATPLTSFVVMSLAASGRAAHPVTCRGVEFLLRSARQDGAWPIDTNLGTWNTTLAINALAAGGEDVGWFDCLDWLLGCQQRALHPFTKAAPGGWGWSDASGAVPDADDTAGALLALDAWVESNPADFARIRDAAIAGIDWLLDLQNADGGWPTFCRGWGALPFDRSGTDLTAHVMRALHAWREKLPRHPENGSRAQPPRDARLRRAIEQGWSYLARAQRSDGSWVPLWFGNQHRPQEENPVYGTSRVLLAYRDLDQLETEPARRAVQWLVDQRHADGSWGADPAEHDVAGETSSVEETALAVEALLSAQHHAAAREAAAAGLGWLIRAVENQKHRETSPIGFYFAKLWYYERLYPLVFTVSALGRAVQQALPRIGSKPATTYPASY